MLVLAAVLAAIVVVPEVPLDVIVGAGIEVDFVVPLVAVAPPHIETAPKKLEIGSPGQ